MTNPYPANGTMDNAIADPDLHLFEPQCSQGVLNDVSSKNVSEL